MLAASVSLTGCGLSDVGNALSDLEHTVKNVTGHSDDSGTESASAESGNITFRSIVDGIKENAWSTEEPAEDLNGFYRSQISKAAQSVYDQIYTGISGQKSEFYIQCEAVSDIETALRAVLNDHPEFFWVSGNAKIYGQSGGGKERLTLTFNVDASQIDTVRSEIEKEANAFAASLPSDASDYLKVRRAYEYIIQNTDYSTSAEQNQNIQSVFIYHKSVCAGYAKALKYLLNKVGVSCEYVYGTIAGNGASHAWDLVRIGDIYTYVDPTWGDPTYEENEEDSKRLPVIYDYLCLTSEEMTRSGHVLNTEFTYPDCTSTEYDFYRRLNDYFDSFDGKTIQSHLYASVNQGDSVTYFKFGNDESYEEALKQIFQKGGLIEAPLQTKMRQEHTTSMHYYYSKSDDLRTIKIFW